MARSERVPQRVVEKYWELKAECEREDGVFADTWNSQLHQKMTAYLSDEPLSPPAAEQAFAVLERIATAARLGAHKGQGILFEEYAILALGNGEKIQMSKARAGHVLRHIQVLTGEMVVSSQAYNAKLSWFNERLDLFQAGDTLLDVERRHFGYNGESGD